VVKVKVWLGLVELTEKVLLGKAVQEGEVGPGELVNCVG
jgi:hypothetical protein